LNKTSEGGSLRTLDQGKNLNERFETDPTEESADSKDKGAFPSS
jgi:hypothetical protein